MTISEHITEQANKLDLEHLTPNQREWLHYVRSLATLAYLCKACRELKQEAT